MHNKNTEPRTLKQWRELRALTQFELAHRAGVSLGTITGIEARRHDTSIIAARKLALALDTSIDLIRWPEEQEIEQARQRRRSKDAA